MAKHYPAPWIDGKPSDAIVAKYPPEGYDNTQLIEDYGGYLIAETVAPCNKPLIKAAPDMYAKLVEVERVITEWPMVHPDGDYLHGWILNSIREVLSKAAGQENEENEPMGTTPERALSRFNESSEEKEAQDG